MNAPTRTNEERLGAYCRGVALKLLAATRLEYKNFLQDLEDGLYDGQEGLAAERGAEYRAEIARQKAEVAHFSK